MNTCTDCELQVHGKGYSNPRKFHLIAQTCLDHILHDTEDWHNSVLLGQNRENGNEMVNDRPLLIWAGQVGQQGTSINGSTKDKTCLKLRCMLKINTWLPYWMLYVGWMRIPNWLWSYGEIIHDISMLTPGDLLFI